MSINTFIKVGINALLGGPILEPLVDKASEKAASIFKEKFTFTAFEIAETYQESYSYALAAITVGLADPKEKLKFLETLPQSKVEREFSEQIEPDYLQAFAAQQGISAAELLELRQQFIAELKKLVKQPSIFTGEKRSFTESELASLLNDQGTLAITDLILAQLPSALDKTLDGFLRYKDLLGKATLFFFHDLLHKDSRAKTTLETLQRECLLVKVDEIKTTQELLITRLQQQLDEQNATAMQALKAGNFAVMKQLTPELKRLQSTIADVPQRLEAAVTAWQSNHQEFIEFSNRFKTWAQLLNTNVTQVLDEMKTLKGPIIETHENVETLLREFREFKQRFDLSEQIKPRDEFTHHTPSSSAKIQQALAKLKCLSSHDYQYNQLIILAGTVVSSTGDIAEAENLFIEARDTAQNQADIALASFNLFQVRLRREAYPQALADLQTAIDHDPTYALHNINRYPMKKLLGAGGMGCVFLCHDVDENNKLVVVKCFWEGRKGARNKVFKEAIVMRDIACEYVPMPLHWDYADAIRQEKPYFVTEYIEGALDGEAWLEKQGKLDLAKGLDVALQVARGLTVAHQAGVYHLDLKPANLLFKLVKDRLLVKIIDFGLARVATSLKQEAIKTQVRSGKSLLAQNVFGTLDYAPPEQWGETKYGQPGAKSDVFAFGATLYRLLSGESPRFPHLSELPDVPKLQFLLLDCLKPNPDKRPNIKSVMAQLSDLQDKLAPSEKPQEVVEIQETKQEIKSDSFFGRLFTGKKAASEKPEKVVKIKEIRQERKPGTVFRDRQQDGSEGPEMVIIAAGRFQMGDIQGTGYDDEKPVHKVSLKSFAMGRYPVTVGDFRQFVKATGYKTEAEKGDGAYVWKDNEWQQVKDANWSKPYFSQKDNQPVVCVSWNDAVAYVKWLSEQTGQQYSLPTEAQWEYTARAKTKTDYWWGNEIGNNRANCGDNGSKWSAKQTSPVGSFEPNPFGLYDTVGNVWEWCADYWGEYSAEAQTDPTGPASGGSRVVRGGSWLHNARYARVACRNCSEPGMRFIFQGFRCARVQS